MAAEVPLPSTSPRCPVSGSQFWRPGSAPSAPGLDAQPRCPQPRAAQPRCPQPRSRAHQTPFCARGLQKIIAVSENAPGAHGIVPRHCSTRAAGMNTVSAATRKRQIQPPPRSPRCETPATKPPPRNLRREAPAANPRAASATSAARPPAGPRLYLDAKSSRARPASSTARSTALSLM